MATPFENKDGLSWADQWSGKPATDEFANDNQNQQPKNSKLSDYNKKVKAAATTGMDKAKVAAVAGAKKAKSGAVSGFQWIKDQYQKKTQK